MSMRCPNCGSHEVEVQTADGDEILTDNFGEGADVVICYDCGEVSSAADAEAYAARSHRRRWRAVPAHLWPCPSSSRWPCLVARLPSHRFPSARPVSPWPWPRHQLGRLNELLANHRPGRCPVLATSPRGLHCLAIHHPAWCLRSSSRSWRGPLRSLHFCPEAAKRPASGLGD